MRTTPICARSKRLPRDVVRAIDAGCRRSFHPDKQVFVYVGALKKCAAAKL